MLKLYRHTMLNQGCSKIACLAHQQNPLSGVWAHAHTAAQVITCLSHEVASFCQVNLAHRHAAITCLLVAQAVNDSPRCFQKAGWRDGMQVLHLQYHATMYSCCVSSALLL